MKDDLGAVIFKKLGKIFSNYSNDSDYKQLSNELFQLFNENSSAQHLRRMIVFVKREHQSIFVEDCKKLAQSQWWLPLQSVPHLHIHIPMFLHRHDTM